MIIKRIEPIPVAKLAGTVYAVLGFIAGIFLSLFSLMGGGAAAGAIFGIGAVIFLPLLYGILGFVATLIGAWIYNAAAKRVGGIEIQTE